MGLLRTYTMVGGMPEAVARFLDTRSHVECDMIRQAVLTTFREDFGKYGRRVNVDRVRRVFDRLAFLIGQRCKYSQLDPDSRSTDVAAALDLLTMARVTARVPHSAGNGVPLAAQVKERLFKLLFLDVGLLITASGMDPLDVQKSTELTLANSGAVAEQVVGQHLLYSAPPYKPPELFYWSREERSSSAEVDYLLAEAGQVVPVEVKAGKTGTLRSLHAFVALKHPPLALRFNSQPPSLLDTSTVANDHPSQQMRLLSLPLYLIGQTRRLIRELVRS
jgi:hypothetical protein